MSKLTLFGEGNASYTLTSATDVDITNATSFSVTLTGSDKTHVNGLLNTNGASPDSGAAYNLAAADDFNTAITSGDSSDSTGNAVTVSNVVKPEITGATYDVTSGILAVTGHQLGQPG